MKESPNESKRAQVNNACPSLHADSVEIEALFATLDRFGGFDAPSGELSIAFLSKAEISRVHQQFMDDPTPTDVITFPGDPEFNMAGEICVCPEIAYEYALANRIDFSKELSLYLAHGYLHLCGFDDIDDDQREEMRRAEATAMKTLSQRNRIPDFRYRPETRDE